MERPSATVMVMTQMAPQMLAMYFAYTQTIPQMLATGSADAREALQTLAVGSARMRRGLREFAGGIAYWRGELCGDGSLVRLRQANFADRGPANVSCEFNRSCLGKSDQSAEVDANERTR